MLIIIQPQTWPISSCMFAFLIVGGMSDDRFFSVNIFSSDLLNRKYFKCDDNFTYFATLDTLPEIEDLIKADQVLHRIFSSTCAIYLDNTTIESEWSKNIA